VHNNRFLRPCIQGTITYFFYIQGTITYLFYIHLPYGMYTGYYHLFRRFRSLYGFTETLFDNTTTPLVVNKVFEFLISVPWKKRFLTDDTVKGKHRMCIVS